MTENPGMEARTYKGSLIRKRIRVHQSARRHFAAVYGSRGFDVNESFIVTADNEEITGEDGDMRIITFEDVRGRVATSVAGVFVVMDDPGSP